MFFIMLIFIKFNFFLKINMVKENTLVVIKPDGVKRSITGEIISRFEKVGLKVIALKMVHIDEEQAGMHYIEDIDWMKTMGEKAKIGYEKRGETFDKDPLEHGKMIRRQLMEYMSMDPVIAMVLEGHNAVKQVRKMVGSTDPCSSAPGTIRGDYSFETFSMADQFERPIQNLIHASGEVEEAEREIKVWFKPEEISSWDRVDEALLYRKG